MQQLPIRSFAIIGGHLHVEPALPPGEDMRFIYRAADGVTWNDATGTLFPMEDRSSDHVAWFGRILDAAREEYGIALEITDRTAWRDVPADVAAALAALQRG